MRCHWCLVNNKLSKRLHGQNHLAIPANAAACIRRCLQDRSLGMGYVGPAVGLTVCANLIRIYISASNECKHDDRLVFAFYATIGLGLKQRSRGHNNGGFSAAML